MLKYGMRLRRIKYWQAQAEFIRRANGTYCGRRTLELDMHNTPSAIIAYQAIAFAAVASPEHLKAVLTGTRGKKWSL